MTSGSEAQLIEPFALSTGQSGPRLSTADMLKLAIERGESKRSNRGSPMRCQDSLPGHLFAERVAGRGSWRTCVDQAKSESMARFTQAPSLSFGRRCGGEDVLCAYDRCVDTINSPLRSSEAA